MFVVQENNFSPSSSVEPRGAVLMNSQPLAVITPTERERTKLFVGYVLQRLAQINNKEFVARCHPSLRRAILGKIPSEDIVTRMVDTTTSLNDREVDDDDDADDKDNDKTLLSQQQYNNGNNKKEEEEDDTVLAYQRELSSFAGQNVLRFGNREQSIVEVLHVADALPKTSSPSSWFGGIFSSSVIAAASLAPTVLKTYVLYTVADRRNNPSSSNVFLRDSMYGVVPRALLQRVVTNAARKGSGVTTIIETRPLPSNNNDDEGLLEFRVPNTAIMGTTTRHLQEHLASQTSTYDGRRWLRGVLSDNERHVNRVTHSQVVNELKHVLRRNNSSNHDDDQ